MKKNNLIFSEDEKVKNKIIMIYVKIKNFFINNLIYFKINLDLYIESVVHIKGGNYIYTNQDLF